MCLNQEFNGKEHQNLQVNGEIFPNFKKLEGLYDARLRTRVWIQDTGTSVYWEFILTEIFILFYFFAGAVNLEKRSLKSKDFFVLLFFLIVAGQNLT